MEKSVEKVTLQFEVVKVTLTGDEVERKAKAATVMKKATDFGAKSISQREEVGKTFLTFQTGNNGDGLKVVLSNCAKSVEKFDLDLEVVKVTLTGDEVERKAGAAKVMKQATDFGAKSISQREEVGKTFLTFQTGNNGDVLKAVLSN